MRMLRTAGGIGRTRCSQTHRIQKTAVDGPGTGWDLHELRHSGLTHLGESGASLLELMAKSRHRKPENPRLAPPTRPPSTARPPNAETL
ncbi:hypothetical protein [Nocardia sp. BMG111209]|uniref:hypothetical protein n=1 Tax=Nocardia sp. BMG111209 TaxID=1160137 RepID=UPI001E3CF9CA|nr:hypothetical protein [Nocardia sp. BMG111209]